MDPVTTFFSSLVSSTLANLVTLFKKDGSAQTNIAQDGTAATGINHGIVQNVFNGGIPSTSKLPKLKFEGISNSEIKKNARLLFVDNQSQADTIKILQKLGWERVEQLEKRQINNTDAEPYRDADLVFVDFKDIGDPNGGEGFSILRLLCEKYRKTKYYILFTAHSKRITLDKVETNNPTGFLDGLWSHLSKGSNEFQLETAIFNGLRRIEKLA